MYNFIIAHVNGISLSLSLYLSSLALSLSLVAQPKKCMFKLFTSISRRAIIFLCSFVFYFCFVFFDFNLLHSSCEWILDYYIHFAGCLQKEIPTSGYCCCCCSFLPQFHIIPRLFDFRLFTHFALCAQPTSLHRFSTFTTKLDYYVN